MRPTFQPSLVNDPFHDPCLYINFMFENRALTFDMGDISALSAGDMLKITHCFITHTHIDHFAGFDRLLRLVLGRDKTIHLFGPENFLNNVEGKLAGYTWNLTTNYAESLTLHATEIGSAGMRTRTYRCRERFYASHPVVEQPYSGRLLEEPGLSVNCVILDHDVPCLGFRLNEQFHININKTALETLGLEPGPWLHAFKQTLFAGYDKDATLTVPGPEAGRSFAVAELADKIAILTPGQTITYITDVVFSDANRRKMIDFAWNSDHLFIESHFLDEDSATAREKCHLTARQAGEIAGRANTGRMTTFHYSPRYAERSAEIEQEARRAYDEYAAGRFMPSGAIHDH